MMFFPENLQAMPERDFAVTDGMVGLLHVLKDEIHGPGGDPLEKFIVQYL